MEYSTSSQPDMYDNLYLKHLADNEISLGVYTHHQVNIFGKCIFYILHPDTKKAHAVTFMFQVMKAVCYCHAQPYLH